MSNVIHMIDPPGGWKYGFPKAVPKKFDDWEEQKQWLISEGYPEKEIDKMGEHFYCRHWEEVVE
jgi:hypothetical protein